MTRLHVAVAAPPGVRAPADLDACPLADLIELRFDLLGTAEIGGWIAASPRPVLATIRSRREGGMFEGSATEAAAVLRAAAEAGAAWIDAEADVRPLLGELPEGVGIVASAHGPDALPAHGDLAKVARPVDDAASWDALCREAREDATGSTFVPYGALGTARVLFAPRLLYGSWDEASGVVAGQPSLAALLDELRAGEVTADAALYGLIGTPPARSPSPAMHNAAFRARARDALYVPLSGMDLETALALPFAGFSVTHPYKGAALEVADTASDDARRAGAVNTLVRNTSGGWDGDNTDVAGLRSLLAPAHEGATAFVYGTGGFARSAAVALTDLGYGVRLGPRGAAYERHESDGVLVNATPSGADGGSLPWLASPLADLVVVDAPYAAAGEATTLAGRASAEGAARVVDGRALLLAQARFQASLFDREAEPAGLEPALVRALRPPGNLVLLGARGAGKSTVGRQVARRFGRPFVDLDDEIARVTGRDAAGWIESRGWDAMRAVEAQLLERAQARQGIVLATGGGVVDHEPSRVLLGAGGLRVHLDVPPPVAAERIGDDPARRPRWPGAASALEEAETLIARREPAWAALAHEVVDASRPVDDVVGDVVRCWGERPRP